MRSSAYDQFIRQDGSDHRRRWRALRLHGAAPWPRRGAAQVAVLDLREEAAAAVAQQIVEYRWTRPRLCLRRAPG